MSRWDLTHELLQRAAWELFAERGYDGATTAQIAKRAGVSEMTLFRHFPSKDALVMSDPFDPMMAELVRIRPRGESPVHALVEGIRAAWVRLDDSDMRALRERMGFVAQTPALAGAIERNSADTVSALAAALTDRGVGRAHARVAATAVIAGLGAALLDWAREEQVPLSTAVSSALDVLGGKSDA